MKKHFRIPILAVLFFILNPINLLNQPNQLNQFSQCNPINLFNQFNLTNQIAWADDTKQQPGAGPIQPTATISKHPSQILPLEVPEDYVIGKGDVLRVFVWRNEQLSGEVVVRPDGKISLPLLQDLQAEGLTVLQLQKKIIRKFSEHLINPKVTVIVNQINSYKVSVLGRVVKPGVYPISGDTTFVEAISMAGGFTEWANKRKITVITHQGGKKKKITVNYKNIISGKDPSQNIILKRGDTIVVH